MKRYIFIVSLLALLVPRAGAQSPHIDHLAIDDPTGRLTIFGSFGTRPGTVTVDSVPMKWDSWSADSIVCTLADIGKGSCGGVQVTNSTGTSNGRLLSAWYIRCSDDFQEASGSGSSSDFHVMFRLDLVSALQPPYGTISMYSITTCQIQIITVFGFDNDSSRTWDTTKSEFMEVVFDPVAKTLEMGPSSIYQFRGIYGTNLSTITLRFDNGYNVLGGTGQISPHESKFIGAEKPAAFIPPDSLLRNVQAVVSSSDHQVMSLTIVSENLGSVRAFFNPSEQHRNLSVTDALGRILANYPIPAEASELNASINLPPGIYFAEMEGETGKFVVLR